jgi:ribulose-phosphate 3-epimerase
MAIICPTITAYDPHEYRAQIEQIEAFAERIHIDLMDGEFAPKASPGLDQIWWPDNLVADIHLMYKRPAEHIQQLVKLKPSLVVIHEEADVDHVRFAEQLREHGIKAGLAILQETAADDVLLILKNFDHVLVFSGHLGFHGGETDLTLLDKVQAIRQGYPKIEISWDGGINADNAKQLVKAGVDVLNTGGFIQKSPDPQAAYATLKSVIGG